MATAGTRANKRVQRELEKFLQDSSSDGLAIEVQSEDCWNVKFSAAVGTIYEGENYTLQVKCKLLSAAKDSSNGVLHHYDRFVCHWCVLSKICT